MSGRLASDEGGEDLDRFSSRVVAAAQLATVLVLAVITVYWNWTMLQEIAAQNERLTQLEFQFHALTVMPAAGTPTRIDTSEPDGSSAKFGARVAANPMQQACANLIGRVADAYSDGSSSKIAGSLEELVKKLGCLNTPPPP
jgi:hypothetical protein